MEYSNQKELENYFSSAIIYAKEKSGLTYFKGYMVLMHVFHNFKIKNLLMFPVYSCYEDPKALFQLIAPTDCESEDIEAMKAFIEYQEKHPFEEYVNCEEDPPERS